MPQETAPERLYLDHFANLHEHSEDLSNDEWETMAAAFEAEDVMRIQDLFDEYKAKMPVFLVMRAMEECQKFYAATSEPSE